jgi:hypothetical protein
MYGQQSSIDPSLAALLQTAQMVTPDQTPTVAAQVAQAAAQKMQPQGIAQGMPQARQDFQAAMPSMMRNMQQQQMQQMVQQAMQPKPAGIEGLPSNIRMAEGGVVGFAGPDGSNVKLDVEQILKKAPAARTPEENAALRAAGVDVTSRQMGSESGIVSQLNRALSGPFIREAITGGALNLSDEELAKRSDAGAATERMFRGLGGTKAAMGSTPESNIAPQAMRTEDAFATPRIDQPIVARVPAPAPQAPAPRPPAQRPPAPAQQAAPTGVAAALAQRPTYDTAGIAAAGTPYIQAGEGDVGRIRKVEGERAEFEKTLPDLSAKGIAALQQRMRDVETAEATRKENLGLDRVIQQLLGRAQGSGGAARADIQFMNAQRAAEDAFSQAKLGNQQAQLLLEKAQQERQLGRFDRAIALEKDAANLMEKARDNALKAQQIAQSTAGSQFQGAVQMRGQDAQTREGELNRANALKVAGIQAAAREGAGDIAQKRLALQQLKADPEYTAAMNKIKELSKAAGLSSSPTIQTAFRAAQQEAAAIARRYGLTPQDIGAAGGDTAGPAGQRVVDFASIK